MGPKLALTNFSSHKKNRQNLVGSSARSLLKEFHPFRDAKHLLGVGPFCEPFCNIPLALHLMEKPRLIKWRWMLNYIPSSSKICPKNTKKQTPNQAEWKEIRNVYLHTAALQNSTHLLSSQARGHCLAMFCISALMLTTSHTVWYPLCCWST